MLAIAIDMNHSTFAGFGQQSAFAGKRMRKHDDAQFGTAAAFGDRHRSLRAIGAGCFTIGAACLTNCAHENPTPASSSSHRMLASDTAVLRLDSFGTVFSTLILPQSYGMRVASSLI